MKEKLFFILVRVETVEAEDETKIDDRTLSVFFYSFFVKKSSDFQTFLQGK